MDAQLLQQELRDYFQAEVRRAEPAAQWWTDAIARAAAEKRPAAWRVTLRRSRLMWVLIPLTALLLAGIAYASSSIIRERFASLFPQVEKTGLAQELNLSQTIDGVTVKVERAYADSNGAMVGYTISGPPTTATGPGARYFAKSGGLAIDGRPVLPVIFESGTVPGSKTSWVTGTPRTGWQ